MDSPPFHQGPDRNHRAIIKQGGVKIVLVTLQNGKISLIGLFCKMQPQTLPDPVGIVAHKKIDVFTHHRPGVRDDLNVLFLRIREDFVRFSGVARYKDEH